MFETNLGQVLQRWKQAFGQYKELSNAAEAAVVRREWTGGERYSLLPFYFNRFSGRARLLKEPPTSECYYIRYGFDEQNRPRLHRFYDSLDLNGRSNLKKNHLHDFIRNDLSETFYIYKEDLVEIIEFSIPPRIPLKVQQIFYMNEHVVRHASIRLNGYTPLYSKKGKNPDALYDWLGPNGRFKQFERYVYDGKLLNHIQFYSEVPGIPPYSGEERFTYEEDGILLQIERFCEDGNRQLVYRKRKKGQTFQSIREVATHKLVKAIIERIRAENVKEKMCLMELSYI